MAKWTITTDVRHPYYDMVDNFELLKQAVNNDPTMKRDHTLQAQLLRIQAEIDSLTATLNQKYLWD